MFLKPKPVPRRRKWLASGPDWEWEAWKQSVYYPYLASRCAFANGATVESAYEPHVARFRCECPRCSSDHSKSKWCALSKGTKPDSEGRIWYADFDVHHVAKRSSHPEWKFSVRNCIPVNRECHRREMHG